MSDFKRFAQLMHKALGEFLNGDVITGEDEMVAVEQPVISAGDVQGMKRSQLDRIAVTYHIPLIDAQGNRALSPKEVLVSPLKKQITEFMTARNMQLQADHAKKKSEEAQDELPLNPPVEEAPPPAIPPIAAPVVVAPPAPVPVVAPAVVAPPAPVPVVAPVAKVEAPVPEAPPVVTPPVAAMPPAAMPPVAPVAPPAPVVTPPVAPVKEVPAVDHSAVRGGLFDAATSACPKDDSQRGVLWNFWTAHQHQLTTNLNNFFDDLGKAPAEVQEQVKQFFVLQGCSGKCLACPHGPSQGSVCYAIFDDTVKIAGYKDLVDSGVSVKMVPPTADQPWDKNTNGQAILAN